MTTNDKYVCGKIGKDCINVIKKLNSKYSHKLLDHAKYSATNALKIASKKTEATGELIYHKIADKTAKVSITSTQNS